jgi:lipopolysaccharide heptosyltransferase II
MLSTHLNMGGITSYVVNLGRALRKRGHIVIVASSGGDMAGELTRSGITHMHLDIKTKSELSPKLVLALPRVLSFVKKNGVEVIHAHTRVTQVVACAVSRLAGIPYVTTCHGFFRPRLGRRLFKCWGDKAIAISDAVAVHLKKDLGVKDTDIELVYNGVDTERFGREFTEEAKYLLRKRLGLGEDRIVGSIGRLSPVKGYDHLIRALRHLRDRYSGIKLLVVGDGPEKERLEGLSRELGVEASVVFVPQDRDTPALLSVMDVFVSSSVQEGLGLSLAEAMASGRAAVATDVGGIGSLIRNNETGLLVRPEDSKSLAGAVSLLLEDDELRSRLGCNGRELVRKDFSIGAMADRIEAVYRGIDGRIPELDRILVMNVNWLGDVIFTTPFIKALKGRFPGCFLACMVAPRCVEILEDNPHVDKIIVYDEFGRHKSPAGKMRLIDSLKRERFNGAFVLHRSFTRALVAFLAGIRTRIGYNTKKRGFLLTKAVDEPLPGIHKVEYFLNLASACGIETKDKDYEFYFNQTDKERMEEFLERNGIGKQDRFAVLNPGGNWPPKRWPKERFAELSDRISRELGLRTLITGAAKDVPLAKEIVEMSRTRPVNAAGRTTLKELGAIMKMAEFVVSSDSGPMHVALGVKTRVIALFGPTSERLTGPYGRGDFAVIRKHSDCRIPCYDSSCRDHRCMTAIGIDDVMEKASEMLKDGSRRS